MRPKHGTTPRTDCAPAINADSATTESLTRPTPPACTLWLELPMADLESAGRTVKTRLRTTSQEASDAVVDALIKLTERGARADDPPAYLATTAINLLRDRWARRKEVPASSANESNTRRPPGLSSAENLSITQEHGVQVRLAHEDETRWRRVMLQRSIDALPARDRDLMVRHYFQGVQLEALDRQHGEKRGTHKLRLYRARNRLREVLKSDPTTWQSLLESLRDPPDGEANTGRGPGR